MSPAAIIIQLARRHAVDGRVRLVDLEQAVGVELRLVFGELEQTGELHLDGDWVKLGPRAQASTEVTDDERVPDGPPPQEAGSKRRRRGKRR